MANDEKFQVQSVEKVMAIEQAALAYPRVSANDNSQNDPDDRVVLPGHYPSATPDTPDRVKKDNAKLAKVQRKTWMKQEKRTMGNEADGINTLRFVRRIYRRMEIFQL